MKAKYCWCLLLILLVCFTGTKYANQVAAKAERPTKTTPQLKYIRNKRDALTDLQGVLVLVEEIGPEAEKYGFTQQTYRTDVELRLRQYGIKVLSKEEYLQMAGRPFLYIRVNPLINEKTRLVAVGLEVKLHERSFLLREPTMVVTAATWSEGRMALIGLDKLNEVRESVRGLVDLFINDYLEVNPKKIVIKKQEY